MTISIFRACRLLLIGLALTGSGGCQQSPTPLVRDSEGPGGAPPPGAVGEGTSGPALSGSAQVLAEAAGSEQQATVADFDVLLRELGRQTGGGMKGRLVADGLELQELDPAGPLARAGLADGDVLLAVNGGPFAEPEQILDATLRVMKARRFEARARRGSLKLTFRIDAEEGTPVSSAAPNPAPGTSLGTTR